MLEMEMEDMDRVAQEAIFSSSSDEEEAGRRSNREGKSPNKSRDFLGAHNKVVEDYFKGRESKYDEKDFERRFRCPRTVFNEIHDAVMGTDPFVHKKDCTGKWGVCPLVKLVGCFRCIACGGIFLYRGIFCTIPLKRFLSRCFFSRLRCCGLFDVFGTIRVFCERKRDREECR